MTDLLLNLFVKDNKNTNDPKVRVAIGNLSSVFGIIMNTLLAIAKILTGTLFGLISLTADGMNNLTDCGSNVVSLISFKMSARPADKDHPFGHQRIEYVASMIVSFIIMFLSFELASESVSKIIANEQQVFSWTIVIVLAVSVMAKILLFLFNRKLAKKINSDLIMATATDSISDAVATFAVLVSVFLSKWFNVALDGYFGLLVSLMIAFVGIKLFKETLSLLIGKSPDETLIQDLKNRVFSYEGVLGIHDLFIHNYGPNTYYASAHIEVDSKVDVMISHDLMDRIERDFSQNTNIMLVLHLDPIDVDDEESQNYKKIATSYVKSLNEKYSLHDFRVVKGKTHTNWIFDVAIPFGEKTSHKEIREKLEQMVSSTAGDCDYFAVITVENQIDI